MMLMTISSSMMVKPRVPVRVPPRVCGRSGVRVRLRGVRFIRLQYTVYRRGSAVGVWRMSRRARGAVD